MFEVASVDLQSVTADEEVGAVHAAADFTTVGAVTECLLFLSVSDTLWAQHRSYLHLCSSVQSCSAFAAYYSNCVIGPEARLG